MMGFFDTVREKANALASDAGRASKVTAAQARLVVLQNEIRKAERELGHAAFDLIERGDLEHAGIAHATSRLREAHLALAAKEAEIAALRAEGGAPPGSGDAGDETAGTAPADADAGKRPAGNAGTHGASASAPEEPGVEEPAPKKPARKAAARKPARKAAPEKPASQAAGKASAAKPAPKKKAPGGTGKTGSAKPAAK